MRNIQCVEVRLYTWSSCSFCQRAKELLDRHHVPWSETPLDGDRALAERLARMLGRKAMPYVLLDGELVGGLEELESMADRGMLD